MSKANFMLSSVEHEFLAHLSQSLKVSQCDQYSKFKRFRENLIFVNSVKTQICGVKNLEHDLPISVND